MVLYERNGTFVGIGKEELSFLGFEDFEEFKSEHKDFADLFVNRPGYIFKFKNFSWIDYTLHSGAPKKSVILRLKNGQEVETGIKICEIFLANPVDNHTLYYGVEITNSAFQSQSFTPSFKPTTTYEPTLSEEQALPPLEDDIVAPQAPVAVSHLEDDYIQESPSYDSTEEPTPSSINFDSNEDREENEKLFIKEDTSDFKLKIDNETQEPREISFGSASEIDEDFDTKLKINFDEDELEPTKLEVKDEEPTSLSFIQDSDLDIPLKIQDDEPQIQTSNEELDFDLAQCAQDVGLDIPEIAELLEEYLGNIETSLTNIENAIHDKNTQELNNLLLPLKGIADNLQIKQISHSLEKMVSSSSEEDKESAYKEFVHFVEKLKEELI